MNWIVLKKLYEVYKNGITESNKTMLEDPQIQYLLESTKELRDSGAYIKIGDDTFKQYYEKRHLKNFEEYDAFLIRNQFKKPQTRFQENDIKILMGIEEGMTTGRLKEIREQIIEAEETVRGVSKMFFKNEKHLEKSVPLLKAVKKLLNISELANDKDQQYKYVLECEEPCCIVICENLDFLKRPSKPRKYNIELWYVGGKNVAKLDYVDTRNLPIYYSGDWDYDGLFIIYKLVKEKIPKIQLLYPDGKPLSIDKSEHKSHWRKNMDFQLFNHKEKALIQRLENENEWIMEEANDLVTMLGM